MSPICGVAKILAVMHEIDRNALQALIAAPVAASAVSRELESAGFKISYQTIYRHRAQTCSCEK